MRRFDSKGELPSVDHGPLNEGLWGKSYQRPGTTRPLEKTNQSCLVCHVTRSTSTSTNHISLRSAVVMKCPPASTYRANQPADYSPTSSRSTSMRNSLHCYHIYNTWLQWNTVSGHKRPSKEGDLK